MFWAKCELREMSKVKSRVLTKSFWIRAVAHVVKRGGCQSISSVLSLTLGGFQTIAHSHQLIYLGNYAVLFRNRRKGKRKVIKVRIIDCGIGLAAHLCFNALDHEWAAECNPEVFGEH